MNKILIGIAVFLSFGLVIVNYVSMIPLLFIYNSTGGTIVLTGIILGFILGFSLKGLMLEKGGKDYNDDEGVNF